MKTDDVKAKVFKMKTYCHFWNRMFSNTHMNRPLCGVHINVVYIYIKSVRDTLSRCFFSFYSQYTHFPIHEIYCACF